MVTGNLILFLLAVEGAIIAQSKHLKVVKQDAHCHHCENTRAKDVASYKSVHDNQMPVVLLRYENQIGSHLAAVINISDVDNATTCSTWFYPKTLSDGSTVCECGSSLGDLIECNRTSHVVGLLHCYCMTYNIDNSGLVVGASSYGCYYLSYDNCSDYPRYALPLNPSSLSQQCKRYNRDGQLCGQCRKGFAPPVYTYGMNCTNRTNYMNNWTK